jgi:competence protein ComEC
MVLRYFPVNSGSNLRILGKMSILAFAFAAGFSLGIPARRAVSGSPELGLKAETINAVSGILREDPRTYGSGSKSASGLLEIRECIAPGGLRSSGKGSVMVFFPGDSIPRLKEFGRGSEIYVDGKFVQGRRGLQFRAESLHVVKPAPPLEQFRTGIRLTLLDKFRTPSSSWGSLASALLLGVRDDLDADLSEAFKNSGCSHILALSGMHLAIISGVLAFFLRKPLGIRWASLTGAAFVVFYIFVAGPLPSLVRAGIMYLIGAFALWGLLKTKAFSILCMAFVIQLIFQSESGISLAFILSYLALAGILTLGETARALFRGRLPEVLSGGLSASIGAFVFTAPVVAYYFASLKPVGILACLVITPITSLFMVLSLFALAAAFLPVPLWNFFDIALSFVYRLLEFTVRTIGRVPGITFASDQFRSTVYVLFFSILVWVLFLFLRKLDSSYRDSIASFD